MCRKLFFFILTELFLSGVITLNAVALDTFVSPSEVLQYNQDKAYKGYTLFTPLRQTEGHFWTYLIDMQGNVVHKYVRPLRPNNYSYLMEDGNFLHTERIDAEVPWLRFGGNIEVLDWDGNVVWEWDASTPEYAQHHDVIKIYNKKLKEETFLVVVWTPKTREEALAKGVDPSVDQYTEGMWSSDAVYEVNKKKEIVWKWDLADHLINGTNPEWGNYGRLEENPGKFDINYIRSDRHEDGIYGPRRDWVHANSVDYNEKLDHVVVNFRRTYEFVVIDHSKTFVSTTDWQANYNAAASDDGDFLYRFGHPQQYNQHEVPYSFNDHGNIQTYGAHDVQWIRDAAYKGGPALPGAGNILLFENGTFDPDKRQSKIFEINPHIGPDNKIADHYVNPPEAGYKTSRGGKGSGYRLSNQVVWSFDDGGSHSFFSGNISGCQRLPNGNTLICSGAPGHIFEVTTDKEVVWEYLNPITRDGTPKTILKGGEASNVFRAYRYGPDYPGLAGKKLVPLGTLTGRLPGVIGDGFKFSKTPGAAGATGEKAEGGY